MNLTRMQDLQASVQDKQAFRALEDYSKLSLYFVKTISSLNPTRIVSPKNAAYIFYQYGENLGHRITRPINTNLFIDSDIELQVAWDRFYAFLADLKKHGESAVTLHGVDDYLKTNEINRIIYTAQQSIGCIGDSFASPNQARKRIGQLFETLVKLVIQEVGFSCESRTINLSPSARNRRLCENYQQRSHRQDFP